jgi:hypothetical protein
MTLSAKCADGVISHFPWGPSPQTPRCGWLRWGWGWGLGLGLGLGLGWGLGLRLRRFACAGRYLPSASCSASSSVSARLPCARVRLEGETDGFDRDSATAGPWVDGVADVDVAGFHASQRDPHSVKIRSRSQCMTMIFEVLRGIRPGGLGSTKFRTHLAMQHRSVEASAGDPIAQIRPGSAGPIEVSIARNDRRARLHRARSDRQIDQPTLIPRMHPSRRDRAVGDLARPHGERRLFFLR